MHDVLTYADRVYGTDVGYVAVAFKRRDDSWNETTFRWPAERGKLEVWADEHEGANLFICPALRAHDGRRRDDGVRFQWLWADVDWAKVPVDRREEVDAAITKYAQFVVFSGSTEDGWENVHVYVRLDRPVANDVHLRMNTGLRDLLYADNKQADNSLLRVPGSRNWKTPAGVPVAIEDVKSGRVVKRATLNALPAFERAARTVTRLTSDGSWQHVGLEGVPRKWIRRAAMMTDEATSRYGGRFKAVWAVTGDLVKAGLDDDVVHTLMDGFPAALSKAADERGYDVHTDVGKRIAHLRQLTGAIDEVSEDDDTVFSDPGTVIGQASDDDLAWLSAIEGLDAEARKEIQRIRARRSAARVMAEYEAAGAFITPPVDTTRTGVQAVADPAPPMPYLIEGMAGAKHNIVITAQYKTGKTTFLVASLARALVDGEPFLGSFTTPADGVRVGHWNLEMDAAEIEVDYVVPSGMVNADAFVMWHGRGWPMNIRSAKGKAWTIDWLREHNVQVWTIDSIARLARMAGVNENDNVEMMDLFMTIDDIKREAGVDVCILIAHTGRAEQQEGKERARAATVIDDWPDARWVMTRDGDVRFLMVEGRGVSLPTTSLDYDRDTGRSTLGVSGGKGAAATVAGVNAVIEIVRANPDIRKGDLMKRVRVAKLATSDRAARELIAEAVNDGLGWIEISGPGVGHARGEIYHRVKDEKPGGGAKVMDVDFGRETHRRGRGKPRGK
jgi:hypothetical protein